VPLAPIVVNTLREWRLACPKGRGDLVFPNRNGNVRAHGHILRGLGLIEAAAGLSIKDHPKYGLHAFRHAAASLFPPDCWLRAPRSPALCSPTNSHADRRRSIPSLAPR
jgi:integrase